MKDQDTYRQEENERTSQALNHMLKVINAKGDTGELKEIANQRKEESLLCSDELFDKQLRVIVEDTIHEDD
ncbi:hypothetical protein PP175_10925 [Aneurinibacillus sp. Ricciae_BoGa-3]|uniref:hypothetical protein n=1 Tax=Aneurinibacillus sp. Ricciae_BoGa-3 TaxID=3022697 RepID=UPI002340012B|nr:hypothetical protein [Aneurinibacillus sp. Ricciae_BoGa-3]WCK56377.1 hypothetical protein PP175_10925 [Aneurinibacillus sp. Ricciae_BoGa-3]